MDGSTTHDEETRLVRRARRLTVALVGVAALAVVGGLIVFAALAPYA